MQRWLVEAYVPRCRAEDARTAGRRAAAAADDLTGEGVPVRYVRTTYLPDDETCFHVFEAETPGAIEETSRRAGLEHARVTAVVEASRATLPEER